MEYNKSSRICYYMINLLYKLIKLVCFSLYITSIKIINIIFPKNKNIKIIGICGQTCSGKTYISKKLCEYINESKTNCRVISQDSYYINGDSSTNYDVLEALDLELLKTHLRDLKSGKTIEMPTYDFCTNSRLDKTITITPRENEIFILEGILIYCDDEILDILDEKYFVHTDEKICFERKLDRDMRKRGRNKERIIKQYNEQTYPSTIKYVLPSMVKADLVLINNNFNFIGLDILKDHLIK